MRPYYLSIEKYASNFTELYNRITNEYNMSLKINEKNIYTNYGTENAEIESNTIIYISD